MDYSEVVDETESQLETEGKFNIGVYIYIYLVFIGEKNWFYLAIASYSKLIRNYCFRSRCFMATAGGDPELWFPLWFKAQAL